MTYTVIKFLTLTSVLSIVACVKLKSQRGPSKIPVTMTNDETEINSAMTLFLSGDVMTGRGIGQAFAKSVNPKIYESYVKDARDYLRLAAEVNGPIPVPIDSNYIWGDAFKFWEQFDPDIRIINLETSITDYDNPWPQKGINYRMHPDNTQTLEKAGIDFCALANNHILDWQIPGLIETLESLEEAGISFAGAGRDRSLALEPAIFEIQGSRLLIFSYGYKSSGIPAEWAAEPEKPGINYLEELDAEKVNQDILHYKKANDIVMLSIHWGGNWGYEIPVEQMNFAHKLIDMGVVDLIHGHSSHHPKGLEVYQNKLIIYGAGDFINDYEGIRGHESYRGEISLMYFPELDATTGDLLSMTMVPMEIRRFQLHHADHPDVEWMQKRMDRECRKFGREVRLNHGMLQLE